jgi:hypothetical protein
LSASSSRPDGLADVSPRGGEPLIPAKVIDVALGRDAKMNLY